jgi:hypothetical protein
MREQMHKMHLVVFHAWRQNRLDISKQSARKNVKKPSVVYNLHRGLGIQGINEYDTA